MRQLDFFFDVISPNAYLAWTQVHGLAERHGWAVEPVPVLFAALLGASGRPGPAEQPAMWAWMVKNVLRKAALLDVPLARPASHPFNPLLALRAASLDLGDDERRALVDGLFRAAWAEGRDVSDAGVVAAVADAAGLEGEEVVVSAGSPKAKTRLREQTDAAIARGVFGVPTMIAGGELFWGYDDFPYLERCLAGRDTLPLGEFERWRAIRPSAWRSGQPPKSAGDA